METELPPSPKLGVPMVDRFAAGLTPIASQKEEGSEAKMFSWAFTATSSMRADTDNIDVGLLIKGILILWNNGAYSTVKFKFVGDLPLQLFIEHVDWIGSEGLASFM
jgi:hypothetical protein